MVTESGAVSAGFTFRVGQIEYRVANNSSPQRCFFGAVLPGRKDAEMGLATCYTFDVIPRV